MWAEIADAKGFRKERPGVIITPTDQIQSGGSLEVVAVTSHVPTPLPLDHVLLPWHPAGHPRTGLNRKSAAVCSWIARIQDSDIRDTAGLIPASVLRVILDKIAALIAPSGPIVGSASASISGSTTP